MWISEPTPVISSTKLIDSGSIRSPNSTCSWSTGIQSNIDTFWTRSVSAIPVEEKNSMAP